MAGERDQDRRRGESTGTEVWEAPCTPRAARKPMRQQESGEARTMKPELLNEA